MSTTRITAAAISRILGNAGFPRSESTKGRIHGMRERTAGIAIEKDRDNELAFVRWRNSSHDRSPSPEAGNRQIEEAADVLRGKGYAAELREYWTGEKFLRVTIPAASAASNPMAAI